MMHRIENFFLKFVSMVLLGSLWISSPLVLAQSSFPKTVLDLEIQAQDDPKTLYAAAMDIVREFNPQKISDTAILAFVAIGDVETNEDWEPQTFEKILPLVTEEAHARHMWPEYLRLKAKLYRLQHDKNPESIPDFNSLIQEAKDLKVTRLSRVFLVEIANHLYDMGLETQAGTFYAEASRVVFLKDLHEFDRAMMKNHLAIYLAWKNQKDRAQQLYEEAYLYAEEAHIRNLQSAIGYNLGRLFVDQKIPAMAEKSLDYFRKSAELAADIHDDATVGSNYLGLSMAYDVLGQPDLGIDFAHRAIAIFQGLDLRRWLSTTYLTLARNQLKKGLYSAAIIDLEKAQDLLDKSFLSQVVIVESELARSYAAVQNWELAYRHESRARKNSDTLNMELTKKQLAEESAKIGVAMLTNDLKINELERANQSNKARFYVAISVVLILSLAAMMLLVFRLHKRNEKVQKLQSYIQESVLMRFLPPLIVEEIIQGKSRMESKPRAESITVLFSDIVNFTALSCQLGANEISSILNTFMQKMAEVVYGHEGTIDKFIGDSVMVIFGAPLPLPESVQAERAVACARDMLRTLEEINLGFKLQFGIEIALRVGINQGSAIVGTFGCEKRSDYTAIGPTVNLASRIEGKAKPNEILVSPDLARHLPLEILEDRGLFKLKGIENEMRLFALKSP